jgi:hypothetical protein
MFTDSLLSTFRHVTSSNFSLNGVTPRDITHAVRGRIIDSIHAFLTSQGTFHSASPLWTCKPCLTCVSVRRFSQGLIVNASRIVITRVFVIGAQPTLRRSLTEVLIHTCARLCVMGMGIGRRAVVHARVCYHLHLPL